MHGQKWGEGSDKPIIPMTKHRIKTHTMDYMSLDNIFLNYNWIHIQSGK
jgi:hypothetical protein